jgi:hypothetical protein
VSAITRGSGEKLDLSEGTAFTVVIQADGAAGRGRPPQAAARRAGLEVVEKLLTSTTDQVRRASSGSDGSGCKRPDGSWAGPTDSRLVLTGLGYDSANAFHHCRGGTC